MNCEDEDKPNGPPSYDPPTDDHPNTPHKPPEKEGGADGRCKRIAGEVNKELHQLAKLQNKMVPCEGPVREYKEEPFNLPSRIEPWMSISWGDSKCDCIESDDTEIMYLTICNPYTNLTLSNVSVQQLLVSDDSGKAVPKLPNGDPCIQLVPLGPYYFDDIPPKSCVSRQFLLRLRGALGGKHRILLKGLCFDACIHGDHDACFTFDVCKD